MLKHTFQHIAGLGAIKELTLWESGIVSWDDFLRKESVQLDIFSERPKSILFDSIEALNSRNADFFAEKLIHNEFYRIALTFPEDVMFLDIETTGLSKYYDHITLIGWSFLNDYNVYYKGLDNRELIEAFNRAKCIITFNGSLFDVPFIKSEFSDLRIPMCHIDLRFMSRRFGYTGGQKEIEKQIGFVRNSAIGEMTGEFAPVLWHKYKEGNLKSLRTLITYNKNDIDGMKFLFDLCIRKCLDCVPKIKEYITPTLFSHNHSRLKFCTEPVKGKIVLKEYSGQKGTRIKLSQLPIFEKFSIVGIDLTGSEERATGWCHLISNKVITKRINSDQDIISETLKCKPDLISIDSPLSLPIGRTTVFDDDEGREKYGIMRECERMLKRRGVSVYPCLIPSMQKLTRRGMHLAEEFRKMGIPVIESYPGAAQDILGIPRKRQSLEFLIKGLISFGLHGDYETNLVSHDELDAITSAMLGYFFWCGKFEALGNDEEDYLIIPDVEKEFPDWKDKRVIGISGALSTGKTTSGQYLSTKGFAYGRFSMIISKLVQEAGIQINRKSLQEMGDFVNKNRGQRWLCNKLISDLFLNQKRVVIDGLRFPEDHAFMKERFGYNYLHIHLISDDRLREERYKKDGRNDVSFDEANKHNVERDISKLMNLSDLIIENNYNLSYLYDQLHTLIR